MLQLNSQGLGHGYGVLPRQGIPRKTRSTVLSHHASPGRNERGNAEADCDDPTLVTAVPLRKKAVRSAKKMLQGCIACIIAVRAATTIPAVVSELRL